MDESINHRSRDQEYETVFLLKNGAEASWCVGLSNIFAAISILCFIFSYNLIKSNNGIVTEEEIINIIIVYIIYLSISGIYISRHGNRLGDMSNQVAEEVDFVEKEEDQ